VYVTRPARRGKLTPAIDYPDWSGAALDVAEVVGTAIEQRARRFAPRLLPYPQRWQNHVP
jgi:hypothetical protein